MGDALRVLAVLALVAGNAFFVIGEYAVVTARRSGLVPRAEAGSAGARAALKLMDDPVRVISTVQVGITAIGILTGAVAEPLVRELIGDWMPSWLSFVLSFTIITYLSVVLGELVPKALTLQRAETLAALVARPIELIAVALSPLVWVLQNSAAILLRPFGVREVVAGETIRTADELRALIDEAEGAGVIPRAQEELLHNVFEFATREARDVMIPAPDVAWLDAGIDPDAALDVVIDAPHSRYPVGDGSLGRLVGVVHVSALIAGARGGQPGTVGELARPALVVPETKDLGALLRELREQRQQLAAVVDEYGVTAGIVALEDVLEELVGEIEDEFDLPDATITWLDDRTVRVAGSMTIDDANEELGIQLPQRGPRTLAGLTFDALGRRPVPGDPVEIDDVQLRVETMNGLRITQLQITLPGGARDSGAARAEHAGSRSPSPSLRLDEAGDPIRRPTSADTRGNARRKLVPILVSWRDVRTRFILSFVEEARAREAASILDRRGFEVRVLGPDNGVQPWSVHAVKEAPGPVSSRGFGLTELRLGWLARRLGGKYEGHQAQPRH